MEKKQTTHKLPRILTDRGERKALTELLRTSYPTVRGALRGEVNTPLALRIRKLALARGGVEAPVPTTPSPQNEQPRRSSGAGSK